MNDADAYFNYLGHQCLELAIFSTFFKLISCKFQKNKPHAVSRLASLPPCVVRNALRQLNIMLSKDCSFPFGETIKTAKDIRLEKAENDKTFGEIAKAYFEIKGGALKGITTDTNRYQSHLSPMFDSLSISQITPLHIEQLRKKFIHHKPATLWNTFELLRRIINLGYNTNRQQFKSNCTLG